METAYDDGRRDCRCDQESHLALLGVDDGSKRYRHFFEAQKPKFEIRNKFEWHNAQNFSRMMPIAAEPVWVIILWNT